MPQEFNTNELFVIIISNLNERKQLHQFCLEHNVPITYPELFKKKELNLFWGVSKNGVGLVGAYIVWNSKKENVFHSFDEFLSAAGKKFDKQ